MRTPFPVCLGIAVWAHLRADEEGEKGNGEEREDEGEKGIIAEGKKTGEEKEVNREEDKL